MTYAEARDAENLRILQGAINAFIAQRKKPDKPGSGCARQTVFFFPGGTASRLIRATKSFNESAVAPQTFTYKPIWFIPATPFGGALELAMYRSGGTWRDKGDRIVLADEALNLAECTPHDGLIQWSLDHNVDLFVFPWDWRRRLDETVTFFVGTFLPHFRAAVMAAGCPDPLASFALIGHSFGGMIANLLLRANAPILATMTHAITVGTPFYGYTDQVHRWFEGENYLNFFGLLEEAIMETIASLPGLYTLHFLDEDTFAANATSLSTGNFAMPDYPSVDETKGTLHADPYNPQTYGSLVRYPGMTGFDLAELAYAKLQFQALVAPMAPNLLQKFHNIRGVKTGADGTTPVNNTAGSVTWDWIALNYDASDATPIVNGPFVPGDGTQPAWTTCLVGNGARCVTVKGTSIDHSFLMNHTGVLAAIGSILCPAAPAVSPSDTPAAAPASEPEPASDEEMVEFVTWLSQDLPNVKRLKSFDDPELRRRMPDRFRSRLPNLARRFISDVLKRPGPEGLRSPDYADKVQRPGRGGAGDTGAGREPSGSDRQRKPPEKRE